jgi:hypothetical protein
LSFSPPRGTWCSVYHSVSKKTIFLPCLRHGVYWSCCKLLRAPPDKPWTTTPTVRSSCFSNDIQRCSQLSYASAVIQASIHPILLT